MGPAGYGHRAVEAGFFWGGDTFGEPSVPVRVSVCARTVGEGIEAILFLKPIDLLGPVRFMRCRTSTSGLSTW